MANRLAAAVHVHLSGLNRPELYRLGKHLRSLSHAAQRAAISQYQQTMWDRLESRLLGA